MTLKPFDVIGFDADDTLWHSEDGFHASEQQVVQMLTPYVAEALGEVKYDQLQKTYSTINPQDYGRPLNPKDFEKAWVVFQQIRDFYEFAARDLSAMLFVAQRPSA